MGLKKRIGIDLGTPQNFCLQNGLQPVIASTSFAGRDEVFTNFSGGS